MNSLVNTMRLRIWKDTRGQDMLEYALIAAFIAAMWGVITVGVAINVSTVFSKVTSSIDQSQQLSLAITNPR